MTATTIEEQEEALKRKIKKRIKDEMWERKIDRQEDLAGMIGEGTSQTSRAINGENSPKSKAIRKKIFTLFNITDL